MAVAFVSIATAVDPGPFGTDTTPTVTKPAGTVSGHLLLAAVGWDFDFAGSNVITWPSGFTELFHQKNDGPGGGGEHMRLACAWKLAGGSEPADYTTTLPGNDGGFSMAIAAYSGCHQTTPINISGSNLDDNAGSPEDVTANSITTTVANCMLVALFTSYGTNPGNNFWTVPASFNERSDFGMTNGIGTLSFSDLIQAGAGASGAKVAVAGTAIANCAGLVALRPADDILVSLAWIRA